MQISKLHYKEILETNQAVQKHMVAQGFWSLQIKMSSIYTVSA